MTGIDVKMDTRAFRQALISVLPHVSTEKDDFFLGRVRAYATGGNLVLCATDRFTAAMAWVELDEADGEVGCLDLMLADAQQLLAVHRVPKEGSYTLQIRTDGQYTWATDVSGLGFGGRELRMESVTVDKTYPDVAHMLGLVAKSTGWQDSWAEIPAPLLNLVHGQYLARFAVAGKVFDDYIAVESVVKPMSLLVTVGDTFIGALMPRRDSHEASQEKWQKQFRLDALVIAEDVATAHPTPPRKEQPADVVNLDDLIPAQDDDEDGSDG